MTINNSLNFHIEPYDLYGCFFESVVGLELARRGLRHTFHGRFGYLPNLPTAIDQHQLIASEIDREGRVQRELRAWDEGIIEIKIERSPEPRRHIEVWGYFPNKEETECCLSIMVNHLPPETTRLHDGTVIVNFWNAAMERGNHLPRRESQSMRAPQWQQIAMNYPKQVRPELDHTMQLKGANILLSRLLLWRGLPGTGKTWAIRALMREWFDWCTFHYVVDPAVFFSNGAYMLSLLSKVGEVEKAEDGEDRKWSLVILEDAGEFIALESRHQYGQALAKLLNLSDGLLGQGQKLLFLITTNEEVQNIHPAIVRQGRCLTNLEFPEFSQGEAREWLASHGDKPPPLPNKLTLSDLYANIGRQAPIVNAVPPKRAGFTR
jgi:hypothetical protein